MVRDAYAFVIPLGLLGLIALLLAWFVATPFYYIAIILLLLALFVAFFFRDPERNSPTDERLVVSPADGLVVVVKPIELKDGRTGTLVSIFLSIFDVHINRTPIGGTVTDTEYRPGKFLVASLQRASVENEQNTITVRNQFMEVQFKQIAGLIARRIVCWKKTGDNIGIGERVGLIKFGSRVDIMLPPEVNVAVKKGNRVKGGESIIGRLEGA